MAWALNGPKPFAVGSYPSTALSTALKYSCPRLAFAYAAAIVVSDGQRGTMATKPDGRRYQTEMAVATHLTTAKLMDTSGYP